MEDTDMIALSRDVAQARMLLSTHNTPGTLGSAPVRFSSTLPDSADGLDARINIKCVEPRKWAAYMRPFEARLEVGGWAPDRQPLSARPCDVPRSAFPVLTFQCLDHFERPGAIASAVCVQKDRVAFRVELIHAEWSADAATCQTTWRVRVDAARDSSIDWAALRVQLIIARMVNDDGRATVVRMCTPARAHLHALCSRLHRAVNVAAALAAAQQLVHAFFYRARVTGTHPDWLTVTEDAALQAKRTPPALADVPPMWRDTMFESAWLACAAAASMNARHAPLCARLLHSDLQHVLKAMDALATQVLHYETAMGDMPFQAFASDSGQWLDQMRSVGERIAEMVAELPLCI